jgi:tetratricopeptide (TPR) repeat protein
MSSHFRPVIFLAIGSTLLASSTLAQYVNRQRIREAASAEKDGDYNQAIAIYTEIIDAEPNDAGMYARRAWNHRRMKEYDEALSDATTAIRLTPHDPKLYINRGWTLNGLSRYDEAIVDFNRAIRLDPKNPNSYHARAGAYVNQRKYAEAMADYESIVKLEPNDPEVYCGRGSVYRHMRLYDKARKDFEHAKELNGHAWQPYYSLAWLLATCPDLAFRDGQKALEFAKKARELSHNTPDTVDIMAAACDEAGDFQQAVQLEEEYLKLPGVDPDLIPQAKARLELYRAGKPFREDPDKQPPG